MKATVTTQEQTLDEAFESLQYVFRNEPWPEYQVRAVWLRKLKENLLNNQEQLCQALNEDYGYRSEFDSLLADILPSIQQLNYTLKNLKQWMKPSARHAGLLLFPSSVKVHYQPVGVVGVIVPWNFPVFLSLGPVITALAAGNRVMVKMSEFTPATNRAMQAIFAGMENQIILVEGDSHIAAQFSALPFNHLFFTGSTQVGKRVAQAAAKNLTPVTLELGGKSPVIIAPDADIQSAVDNILLGKCINAGQICVAPDYVFLPEGSENAFIATYLQRYAEFYQQNNQSNQSGHIIDQRQIQRLDRYLQDAVQKGAVRHQIQNPIQADEGIGKGTQPCLLTGVNDNMLIMQEEIFGPILPVMTYQNVQQAFDYIRNRPRPLALYLMSKNSQLIEQVIHQSYSGGVCINDTLVHVGAEDAPFGGTGESGIGHYHGHEGFKTFSHAKTIVSSFAWLSRNGIILKNRDLAVKLMKKVFLR
ncbi:coniferyl aldehyde dehydrogenase [Oceanospirillum sp. D5]|uniref:Aldehyde dehydrogenase n=2 Tax=Oceanospirillum sediminis TaxID=2760088 RepID=A0A839IWY5_9GAMM|nr:coniferyl aldehyde dehydrogenase [Oceanospirillum sediminis]